MNGLGELKLKTAYHKGKDDIASQFYLPCMSRAVEYDRAVGFFSSTIYIIAWPSLKAFVNRGGRMRIICSPVLSTEDIEAIESGYIERVEQSVEGAILQEVEAMLANPYLHKPAKVLAALIAENVVDVKVAIVTTSEGRKRLFHDKLGLFKDHLGNCVAFKGSMNETWTGLSSDGNIESVDVFVSWDGERDRERVVDHTETFESLWNDDYPTASVKAFPDVARSQLISAAEKDKWIELVDEICEEITFAERITADRRPGGRVPRPHQMNAIDNWHKSGRRGIFQHATGSGKTFTALCTIRDSMERGEVPMVLVPSDLLLQQWDREIRDTLGDIVPDILLCGGGNTSWRTERRLQMWTRNRQASRPRIVVSTMQTAAGDEFRSNVKDGPHLFMVADEVHRIGSNENRKVFEIDSGPRLGLSATPQRYGDPLGTQALMDYFGGVVEPVFTLRDAIEAKTLTPYFYNVHTVLLTDTEQLEWNKLTDKIRKIQAQARRDPSPESIEMIERLAIARARIVRGASQKASLAVRVVEANYLPGQRWLIYCDDQRQLSSVLTSLRSSGFEALEYHTAMVGDKEQTLRNFQKLGGILVSIRCLDEGVDIPAASHALILASSRNPREFIQRRGRVLRVADDKTFAFLHDAIVLPNTIDVDMDERSEERATSIIENELRRAIEFGQYAENAGATTDLQLIALRMGLDNDITVGDDAEDDDD